VTGAASSCRRAAPPGPARVSGSRTGRAVVVVATALAVAALPTVTARAAEPAPPPTPAPHSARTVDDLARAWRAAAPATVVVGRSVLGRTIVATRQGPGTAPYVLLVLGQMHGSEPRGRDVVASVRRLAPPAQVQVWTITTMNPDGAARGRRTNARGVDLNRNFPVAWSGRTSNRTYFWPGPAPASEPEARAMMVFLDRVRPDLVVSLHQHFDAVDLSSGRIRTWSLRLAAALRLRARVVPCSTGPCTGTMTQWFNHEHLGAAVTVELPLAVSSALSAFYARGILRVAAALVPPSP
jgi:protein MpaA